MPGVFDLYDPKIARRRYAFWIGMALLVVAVSWAPHARAQAPPVEDAGPSAVDPDAPDNVDQADDPAVAEPPADAETRPAGESLNLFVLIWQAKWFMIPIGVMSLIVVAVAIERFIGLQSSRVIPEPLVTKLAKLSGPTGFDPREAYRLCQQYPSATAAVIKAMLLKVGRPHSEVEHAVAEASDRESQRLYGNCRWLNLASSVSPLLGLFGTVWGMIMAFHETTNLIPGQNKAEYLARGIYLALVTTLGGLAVAIPAAILSHYFEGRVQSLFHRIDELLFNLMPQIERFEGRVRFAQGGKASEEPGTEAAERRSAGSGSPQTPAPPPPAPSPK